MGTVALVLEAPRLEEQLREAALWCDRATLCLTGPNSSHGEVAAWQALLGAAAKLERACVNVATPAEGWLLHRLQETGALRLLESEAPRLRGNLLIFRRGLDARCWLVNGPLSSATLSGDCGVVIAYAGAADADFARSCQRLADEWRDAAHVPTGSELDRLTAAPQRAPLPSLVPTSDALEVITGAAAVSRALDALVGRRAESPPPASARLSGSANGQGGTHALALPEGGSLTLTSSGTRHELTLVDAQAPAPVVLTLWVGEDLALGNTLLLHAEGGPPMLAWRGGLLGSARNKNDALWAQCRFPTLSVHHDGLGGESRVAVIAVGGSELGAQLVAFAREHERLRALFATDASAVAETSGVGFAALSEAEQRELVWRALLGQGALRREEAATTAAQWLHERGYVEAATPREPGSPLHHHLLALLTDGARESARFDEPDAERIRAIQPNLEDYRREHWLECLVNALPEGKALERSAAMRLILDYARAQWGLGVQRLRAGGKTEQALKSTLNSGIRRGLLRRIGAAYVERVTPGTGVTGDEAPPSSEVGAADEARERGLENAPASPQAEPSPTAAIDASALQSDARPAPLVGANSAPLSPPTPAVVEETDPLTLPMRHVDLPVRASNWAEARDIETLGALVAWHPDVFAAERNIGRLTLAETRAVVEKLLGREWEEAWAALPEPKMHPPWDPEGEDKPDVAVAPDSWDSRLQTLAAEHHELLLTRLDLPSRMRSYCEARGLTTVGALLRIPRDELLGASNLGRSSLRRTLEALDEALTELAQPRSDEGFLAGWRRQLSRLPSIQRLVLSRRCGLHGTRETLEAVGEMLGVTRERVRQIEAGCLEDIRQRSSWVDALRERLNEAFANARCIALRLLLEEDPWWAGTGEQLDLLDYVLERLLDGETRRLSVEYAGRRDELLARFAPTALRAAEQRLLERAQQVALPADIEQFEALVESEAAALDLSLRSYLRATLDEHLNFDAADATRVVTFGNTRPAQILALLASQPEPVPITFVHETLGRCNLPDEVLYFRRGLVGLEQHFPDFRAWQGRLVPACVRLMQELPAGRQWLVPELHQALSEAGEVPEWLGHWHLASLLRRSDQVAYLGRLRVALPNDDRPLERIHHQDAARSTLLEAGAPLGFAAIAAGIRRRTDILDATLTMLLLCSPFVRLAPDRYGLIERDVPGGAEAIARGVQAVIDRLESTQRGLTSYQATRLAAEAASQAWPVELVTSLLRSEPQLRLSRQGHVGLSNWDDARVLGRGELMRQQVEKAGGRLPLDALQRGQEEAYGRPLERSELALECEQNQLQLSGDDVVALTVSAVSAGVAPLALAPLTAAAPTAPAHELTPRSAPSAPSDDVLVNLTGRVGGIPAAAREHFEALLAQPLRSPAELLAQAREHLAAIEDAGHHNEFIDVAVARRLVELHERLLTHVASLSVTTQRIAQAAIRYFISTQDAEDDFDFGGLEDDQAVLSAVLRHLELDWS